MDRKRTKRKRFFSSNLMAKKNRDLFLTPGMKGFICTCNGNEKQCIREAYNILNEYADQLYGEENPVVRKEEGSNNAATDDDDILDEFEKEVDSLKTENATKARRFQAVDVGIHNCIFIKTSLNDPVLLMQTVVKDLSEKKQLKARFLLRMIPVEVSCKAFMDEIEHTAGQLFDVHFKSEPTTYGIVFTKRCNSSVERDPLIEKLAAMVQERNSEHKVNLTNPEVAIVVELMKNICAMSVIKNYFQMSKYNLRQVCGLPADFGCKTEAVSSSSEVKQIAEEAAGNQPQNVPVDQEKKDVCDQLEKNVTDEKGDACDVEMVEANACG